VWMGYPKGNVPMTDVHGEPQQGGALPAVIWKTYMGAVTEGKSCVEFPQSKEAISYVPFYGHYASTGQALSSQESAQEHEHATKPRGHHHVRENAPKPAGQPPPAPHTPPVEVPSKPVRPPVREAPAAGETGGAPAG